MNCSPIRFAISVGGVLFLAALVGSVLSAAVYVTAAEGQVPQAVSLGNATDISRSTWLPDGHADGDDEDVTPTKAPAISQRDSARRQILYRRSSPASSPPLVRNCTLLHGASPISWRDHAPVVHSSSPARTRWPSPHAPPVSPIQHV
jgi:hypothetical protein